MNFCGHKLLYGISFLSSSFPVSSLALSGSLEILFDLLARNFRTLLTTHCHGTPGLSPCLEPRSERTGRRKSNRGLHILLGPIREEISLPQSSRCLLSLVLLLLVPIDFFPTPWAWTGELLLWLSLSSLIPLRYFLQDLAGATGEIQCWTHHQFGNSLDFVLLS